MQITSPSAGFFTVTMTGTPAAESYLCCTSTAAQTFHLVQEFEVSCSDPRVRFVALTLDSSLVGYVRGARKAGASVRLATASVIAESSETSPLSLSHPTLASSGTEGHLCNQHLPPLEGRLMPIGRYTLVADFVLETTASGISTRARRRRFLAGYCAPRRTGCERETLFRGSPRMRWVYPLRSRAVHPRVIHHALA